jgi:hypothetical protein
MRDINIPYSGQNKREKEWGPNLSVAIGNWTQ